MEETKFPIQEELLHDTTASMHSVRQVFTPSVNSNVESRATPGAFSTAKWSTKAISKQAEADKGLAPLQYISVGPTSQVVTPAAEEFLTSHTNYMQTNTIGSSRKQAQSMGLRTGYGIV